MKLVCYDDTAIEILAAVEAGIIGLRSISETSVHAHEELMLNGLTSLLFLAIEHFHARQKRFVAPEPE